MSARRARIGIVGAGFWAVYFYLPFLRDQPDAECVGVVRHDGDGLDALRRGFDLAVATTRVEELLEAGCDGIVVSSSHAFHREHAEAALRAGAHVLVEKPMTLTLADARALARVAREQDRVLSVAHGWNYNPLSTWAMDVVDSGALGRLTWIDGQMASALSKLLAGAEGYGAIEVAGHTFEASPATWARSDAGGGYLYGQLSHQLGIALQLVRSEPREVFARMNRLSNGVDLDVTVSVQFDDGAIGSFSGHGRLPFGTRYPLGLRVAGEHGVLTLDYERARADVNLHGGSGEGSWEIGERHHAYAGAAPDRSLDVGPDDGLYDNDGPARFLVDLCNGRAVRDRAPADLGVRAVAVMEAALRSAQERRPIEVPAP